MGYNLDNLRPPTSYTHTNAPKGMGYTPANRFSAFNLSDLMSKYNQVRPYQDVNLGGHPYQDVDLPGGPDVPRPERIGAPNRKDYGVADRRDLNTIRGQMQEARNEFYNPTQSGAFKNLMSLASTKTARAAEESARTGREAAARRGYSGGLDVESERASRDRMRELAAQGFEGAHAIREQAGQVYGQQTGAYADVANAVLQADTESSIAYAGDLIRAKIAQGQLDSEYGNQLINMYKAKVDAVMGQGQLRESARKTDLESLLGQGQLREAARGHDLDALTQLARTGLEGWRDQNEAALMREKYGLEENAAQQGEERRRRAAEWDFAFKKKHTDEVLASKAKEQDTLDPRTSYLRQIAGGNPLAQLALQNRRR